jgi:hypothetical protein
MRKFKPVELAQLGWGVATLRVRAPEPWVAAWRGAVAGIIFKSNPQAVSMVLWSAARIWEHQEHSALQQLWLSQQQQQGVQLMPQAPNKQQQQQQPQQQSVLYSGAADTGAATAGPPAAWLEVAERAVGLNLQSYSPHSLSICLWAFAKMGHRPADKLTSRALETVQKQLCSSSCKAADLAVLLYSCAALHYRPNRQWMSVHGAALVQRAKALSVREVANVLWAYGRLGVAPHNPDVMRLLMKQLYYGMQVGLNHVTECYKFVTVHMLRPAVVHNGFCVRLLLAGHVLHSLTCPHRVAGSAASAAARGLCAAAVPEILS